MTISSFVEVKTLDRLTNHPYKIQTKLAKVNSFKYFFFVRIVKHWNSLPNQLFTDEINVNEFKKRLKKIIGVREIFCQGGEAVNHLPKKISQVAQIFTKESERKEGRITT